VRICSNGLIMPSAAQRLDVALDECLLEEIEVLAVRRRSSKVVGIRSSRR
jgi:D-ribose pyranose/furanose isomerase RbsD